MARAGDGRCGFLQGGGPASVGEPGDGVLYALGHEVKRAVEVNPSEFPAKSRLGKMLGSLAGQVENARRKWVADASHG